MPRILDPDAPISGDRLRALSKLELRLARLEMSWDRRDIGQRWVRATLDVQRLWRGWCSRRYSSAHECARQRRLRACTLIERSREQGGPDALKWLSEAAENDPTCGEVFLTRAALLHAIGQHTEAVAAIGQALERLQDTIDPRALLLRARAAAAIGDLDTANTDLTAIIDRENDSHFDPKVAMLDDDDALSAARFCRGTVRSMLGDWSGARYDFEAYVASVPRINAPRLGHVQTNDQHLLRRKRAKALQCLGVALAATHYFNQAVHILTEAAELDPQPELLCLLARVHCCERQWQLAKDRYHDVRTVVCVQNQHVPYAGPSFRPGLSNGQSRTRTDVYSSRAVATRRFTLVYLCLVRYLKTFYVLRIVVSV